MGLLAWCFFWYAIIARLLGAWKQADARTGSTPPGRCGPFSHSLVSVDQRGLIGARVHASLRMNLTIGLVVVLGLHVAARN